MKSFDELKKLHQSNPQQFEEYRSQILEEFISSAPIEHQRRLRQIQWKVDSIIKTKPTLGALVEISKLMWNSFDQLNETLKQFTPERGVIINTSVNKPVLKLVK